MLNLFSAIDVVLQHQGLKKKKCQTEDRSTIRRARQRFLQLLGQEPTANPAILQHGSMGIEETTGMSNESVRGCVTEHRGWSKCLEITESQPKRGSDFAQRFRRSQSAACVTDAFKLRRRSTSASRL